MINSSHFRYRIASGSVRLCPLVRNSVPAIVQPHQAHREDMGGAIRHRSLLREVEHRSALLEEHKQMARSMSDRWVCGVCGASYVPIGGNQKYCWSCLSETSTSLRTRQHFKLKVISYYSNGKVCCAICGNADINLLSIDHINGGVGRYRKEGSGQALYHFLANHNYPEGFQVLCLNCNRAKSITNIHSGWLRRKMEVLNHYSPNGIKCASCGESDIKKLGIHHIHGGGNKHLEIIGRSQLYLWLKRNNYPRGFKVLCYNCNHKQVLRILNKKAAS